MDEKLTSALRIAQARATAMKAGGHDDDYIVDSILSIPSIPDSLREGLKAAKAQKVSGQVLKEIAGIDTKVKPDVTPVSSEDVRGSLQRELGTTIGGSVANASEFLGIDKIGRALGSTRGSEEIGRLANEGKISQEEATRFRMGGSTAGELAGSALLTASNLVLPGVAGGAVRGVQAARALSTGEKLATAAKTFGKGTGVGYAGDVANNLNSGATGEEALVPGIGTLAGGVLGGAGGVAGLVGKTKNVVEKKAFNDVVDMVAPKISGKEGDRILSSGNVSIDEPGLFSPGKANFSKDPETLRIANAVEDVINPTGNVSRNVNLVKNKIVDVAENQVRPFLKENNVPFNFQDLRDRFSMVQPSSGLKADPHALGTYERVREEMLQDIATHLKKSGETSNVTDMNELWDARKILDKKIENELGSVAFDSPQYFGVKAAARDMRTAFNSFITDSISNPGQAEQVNKFYDFLNVARSRGIPIKNEGEAIKLLRKQMGINDVPEDVAKGAFYKYQMEQMNLMYEALGNMVPKAKGELGKTSIDLFLKDNPVVKAGKSLLGIGALGVGGYAGARALTGSSGE